MTTAGSALLRRIGLSCVVALLLGGCGNAAGSSIRANGPPGLDGRTFVASSWTVDDRSVKAAAGTHLALSVAGDRLSANAGCNDMSGAAVVTNGRLSVGDLMSTEMACADAIMRQEQWYAALLSGEPSLSIDGSSVMLSDGRSTVVLQQQQAPPDAALVGTRWRITSLVEGAGADASVSSVPVGAQVWLELSPDGRLTASTGCRSLDGSYDVRGGRLDVDLSLYEQFRCLGPTGAVDDHVLPTLGGDPTYSIDGDQLTLRTDDLGLVLTAGKN